ncbi:MAG: hypothetical protein MUC49_20570 [Raineya sp.]|jgi:hypothetical protein|nr:hypothetical protein [Raineya sp.]
MKRLNSIQAQNLSFFKFFMISLAVVVLIKIGANIFGEKNIEVSKSTPSPSQSAQTILKG